MCWRSQRLDIYKFILQTWKIKVKKAEHDVNQATSSEERAYLMEQLQKLKSNPPKIPSL